MKQTAQRWINYVVFFVLMIATWLNYWSPWGLLFLYWTINSFRTGRTVLVGEVNCDDDSILFWAIQIAWLVLGTLMILYDVYPDLNW